MFLRNYHNILAASIFGVYVTKDAVIGDGSLRLRDTLGREIFADMAGTKNYSYALAIGKAVGTNHGSSTSYGEPRLVFGTGDIAVNYDDYALAIEYTQLSKSSFVSQVPVYDSTTRKFTGTLSCVLTNTGSNDVTFREMGIVVTVMGALSGTTSVKPVLIYREILDTPITIPAGDAVKYTHTFEFTMPTVG